MLKSFLIIQTAFIGDVILATSLIEKLRLQYPDAAIDFLLRKGNESLLLDHPHVREVLIWDKKKGKIKNLLKLVVAVRKRKYDYVVNVHRFGSSGLITAFSSAVVTIGFDKNPFAFLFTKKVKHVIGDVHEIDRNQKLIESITDSNALPSRLFPAASDHDFVKSYTITNYICVAPTSVWFTKQWTKEKWMELIQSIPEEFTIYLLGAPSDAEACETIAAGVSHRSVVNLSGKLSFLQSAALMKGAFMNFVNDSAPMHLASSVNAPVTAVYCSTVPAFGFGPLSDRSYVVETKEKLTCRPCGLHGHRQCPEGHFKCATTISTQMVASCLTR